MFPIQYSDNESGLNLSMSSKARWKRMRNILNPTFSPAKLKEVNSTYHQLSVLLHVYKVMRYLKQEMENIG